MMFKGALGAVLTAAFAIGASLIAAQAQAQTWTELQCPGQPGKFLTYPGAGNPWPLRLRDNMKAGDPAREALENGVALWNRVQGAGDILELSGSGYNKCKAPDYAGFGVVGIDDGECAESLNLDWWGGNANGVRQYWINGCEIVATAIYAHPKDGASSAELGDVMAHELGHHANYAHNWFGVSVMGYGVNMYWYLTSQDQGFLRGQYPTGPKVGADLHMHRTVLLTALGQTIKPDLHSQTIAPDPVCTPGDCQNLEPGSEISIVMTYGNAGASPAENVRISMLMGPYEIGAWKVAHFDPHSFGTYNFRAKVPEGMPKGDYTITMFVDPADAYPKIEGPSSTKDRAFTGFRVVASGDCGNNCPTIGNAPALSETEALPSVQQGKADLTAEGGLAPEPMAAAAPASAGGCSATGRSAPSPWLLMAVFFVVMARRRYAVAKASHRD
ncbi:MAG: hypothetical protein KC416_03105 [Myxococcales bacterium]|nr:hypothetical protein [Myxococcales bacterium]